MNIGKFLMKNMYIILSILVIVIFFYFVTPPFFNFFPAFTEGFTVDEYKYLAPPPAGNTWSQDTIDKFVQKYNSSNTGQSPLDAASVNMIFINNVGVTEEEAKYYIQNGTWPYDAYVVNYVKQNPDIIHGTQPDGSPQTISSASKTLANRGFYQIGIFPIESVQNPQPLSYQIYMGIVPDPNSSQTDTSQSVSPITSSSLSSASTLSESNYNTLVSLCKNIIPV